MLYFDNYIKKTILLMVIFCIFNITLYAKEVTIHSTGKYEVSEHDTIKMSRAIALEYAKSTAIEEAGTIVYSTFTIHADSTGKKYSKEDIQVYSASMIKTKVLEEFEKDGYYIVKIKAIIDTDQFEQFTGNHPKIEKKLSLLEADNRNLIMKLKEIEKKLNNLVIVKNEYNVTNYLLAKQTKYLENISKNQSKYKNYLLKIKKQRPYAESLMYYYGQGRVQNLKKSKEYFEKMKPVNSTVLNQYSNAIYTKVRAKELPNEQTSKRIFKTAYENNKDETACLKIGKDLIREWGQEIPIIKESPDHNSMAKLYLSDIVDYDSRGCYGRMKIMEISSPYGKAEFSVFDNHYFEILDEFTFLDNKKLLVMLGGSTVIGIFSIDLQTFKINFISDGHYKIEMYKKQTVIRAIQKKSYYTDVGAYWYDVIYDVNGTLLYYDYTNGIDINNVLLQVLKVWGNTHNNKDLETLSTLYLDKVNYYNKKSYPIEDVLKDKSKLFTMNQTFKQRVSNIKFTKIDFNHIKVQYTKEVTINEKKSVYTSYLIFELSGSKVNISGEGDI